MNTQARNPGYISMLLFLMLAACTNPEKPGVDSILFNAKAYTLESESPWAEAVAIKDNLIVYVGDNEGALALSGKNTIERDLNGQMLLPGFIDTHMHPIGGGAYAKALALDTSASVEDWVTAIAAYDQANPDAALIFGYGFLASTFGPTGPTRQMIDAVVSERPVLIMDEGFHGAWANSLALEKLNISQDTPDPVPGFSYYKRDAEGEATGYLLEGTAGSAMDSLNVITEDIITDGTAYVIDVLNQYGVTSVFDAGAPNDEATLIRVLKQLESDGDMTIRIVGSYRPPNQEAANTAVAKANNRRATVKGKRYHYRMLKIMQDGTIEGRTAAMFEDYQGEPGNNGKTVFTEQQMSLMVVGAAAEQIDVHIHALGERAIYDALNAIEVARSTYPDSETRYTICHIEVIADDDMPRFAELDVTAQSTPLWASYDTYGKQFVSEDQFNRYFRFNSLHKLGTRLTWGSDFPASGAGMLGMSPIYQMEIGRTRQNAGDPDAPIQPRTSERLGIDTLIRGYTIDAAWQLHMENEIGSLKIGKKADLVVLDNNLFEVDLYNTHKVKVVMTILDGHVVYKRK